MNEAKVALVEMFAAPQGEGYHAGRWAVFVRLAGCPLACEFSPGVVCDTPYMQTNMKLMVQELFARVEQMVRGERTPMFVLTGGEPVASPQFDAIVERARAEGFYVAVETNGTLWKEGLYRFVDWISVSPKDAVPQTSKRPYHNQRPKQPILLDDVRTELESRVGVISKSGGEYRYVISAGSATPPFYPATKHYVSPAVRPVLEFGCGECGTPFPGFAEGAVARCLEIIENDPRWCISIQQHKVLGVR